MSTTRVVVYLTAASLVNYLAWFAWDRTRDIQPDGSLSGPYEPWQIVGFAAVIAVLAAVAGWNGRGFLGTVIITTVTWLAWTVDAAFTDSSGLWVIGSGMFLLATLIGTALASGSAALVRP